MEVETNDTGTETDSQNLKREDRKYLYLFFQHKCFFLNNFNVDDFIYYKKSGSFHQILIFNLPNIHVKKYYSVIKNE